MGIFYPGKNRKQSLSTSYGHLALKQAFLRQNSDKQNTNDWYEAFYEVFKSWNDGNFTPPDNMKYEHLLVLWEIKKTVDDPDSLTHEDLLKLWEQKNASQTDEVEPNPETEESEATVETA